MKNQLGGNISDKIQKFNAKLQREDIYDYVDSDDERELYDDEKSVLKQFEENDRELEDIAE